MWSDPVFREENSARIRRGWENPESRAAMSAHSTRRFSDPSVRLELGEKIRRTLATPEARAARSEQRRLDWKDPVKRARILEGRRLARLRRLGLPDTFNKE